MNIIPAIDLREGRVVRLQQGDFGKTRRFDFDPVELAMRYRDAGAKSLHVVDLDGARHAHPMQIETISAIAATGLAVQAGGGVRQRADVETLLDAGVARVVIGSVAVNDPNLTVSWLEMFGSGRIVLALDMCQSDDGVWHPAVDAWQTSSSIEYEPLLDRLCSAGLRHALCTDIARDGMAAGPNLTLYKQLVARWPDVNWIASGGVRNRLDVEQLAETGVAACVAGTALLDGTLPLDVLAMRSIGMSSAGFATDSIRAGVA